MTLEANLASIAKSLELIATALTVKVANPTPVTVAAPAPVVNTPVAAPVAAAPVMPAPPTFTPVVPPVFQAPAPVAATPAAPSPFADKNAMMDYVMTSYRALGAEKGAKIQDVLTGIGFKNINDVPVEKWADLKAGIEALKG